MKEKDKDKAGYDIPPALLAVQLFFPAYPPQVAKNKSQNDSADDLQNKE